MLRILSLGENFTILIKKVCIHDNYRPLKKVPFHEKKKKEKNLEPVTTTNKLPPVDKTFLLKLERMNVNAGAGEGNNNNNPATTTTTTTTTPDHDPMEKSRTLFRFNTRGDTRAGMSGGMR